MWLQVQQLFTVFMLALWGCKAMKSVMVNYVHVLRKRFRRATARASKADGSGSFTCDQTAALGVPANVARVVTW